MFHVLQTALNDFVACNHLENSPELNKNMIDR